MKNILIILTVVFFLGCKSKKQNFKGEKLPDIHIIRIYKLLKVL